MNEQHFEVALIALLLSALLAGSTAALQALGPAGQQAINWQAVAGVGALSFISTLLASLKSLYQPSPSKPDSAPARGAPAGPGPAGGPPSPPHVSTDAPTAP